MTHHKTYSHDHHHPTLPEKPPGSHTRKKEFLRSLHKVLIPLLFDLIIPIAGFYGLRKLGLSAFPALLLSGAPTAGFTLYHMLKHKKIDFLALLVLATMAGSTSLTFVTGSVRFMLAKDGWLMGAFGVIFLFSLMWRQPLAYTIARDLFHRTGYPGNNWNRVWEEVPRFRRVWRVSTVIWGIGTLLNAIALVIMAYTLPVDSVPILSGVLHFGLFVLLQLITNIYYRKQRIWHLIMN